MIKLYPKRTFQLPIIAECISPDVFEGKSVEEIMQLPVWEGSRRKTLETLFKIERTKEGESNKTTISIIGNVSRVRRVGAGMSIGEITIHGNVGMHLGEEMRDGKITVYGDAGRWTGSMMRGGIIEIHGNAGDYVGAPYRGSIRGMRGGTIVVHGNVGNEAGAYMRGGTIKVYGNAGQFIGLRMRGGTIFVKGNAESRVGACMTRGKIVICGSVESILPSFTIEAVRPKVKVDRDRVVGPFYMFIGDLTEEGNGRLYVSKPRNPHLSFYEDYLQQTW
ncbi:MAG: formylmethanofuran dehydrogenase subunit C [Candidatus Freyarchaeota archaeon]